MRTPRSSPLTTAEKKLREQAMEEAATLFASQGSRAIDILSDRLLAPGRTADERRADRLALRQVEHLDRERRKASDPAVRPEWRMPLLRRAGLRLFGPSGER
ncbi:hypothetical protein [Sphingomonas morindae]|uniref:Uncharacterized protein n=1 Tax=Sphingomonas morindae TaxID=1541170 RepID=A0ABY4X879_9SPHN|nr:hypothetical protein [Sphingomonas morindae]USI73153.1 hypothetical protein LHA26_01330 [Sphingomonas morindae]